jgi:hypothetical protein
MKRLLVSLLCFISLAFAEKVFFADELREKDLVPTIDLSATILTDLQAWTTIEDVKSAGKDKLVVFRDPSEPSLLYLTSRPGVTGETDLILKIDGRRYRFRLLLGTKTLPLGYLIYEKRLSAKEVLAPSPLSKTRAPAAPTPLAGPVEAPVLETVVPATPKPDLFYLGLSVGYPPYPIDGELRLDNLNFGMRVGLLGAIAGLDLQLQGGYVPRSGSWLFEGYLMKSGASSELVQPYLGVGGGINSLGGYFAGGLLGIQLAGGILPGPVLPWVELVPRYGFDGTGFSVGGRLGLGVRL